MHHRLKYLFFIVTTILVSCTTKNDYNSSPKANFRALWQILDEGYCFFEEKLPDGKTWQMLYDEYEPLIDEQMSPDELFDMLECFIAELKDGHVNLFTPFDVSHYSKWRYDYPANVDDYVRYLYLGNDFRTAGSAHYTTITYNNHAKDSIGFIIYSSFASSLSNANINAILQRMQHCKGLIIDCRNNGGGSLTTASDFAAHFCKEKKIVAYMKYKTGPDHQDFSLPKPVTVEPTGVIWQRPVILLTNRGMYSAANAFALYMKEMPYVTLLGDYTGGGGGMPRGSELPNGWRVRYSSSVIMDVHEKSVEFGVEPDISVQLQKDDLEKNQDTLIERAINEINKQYDKALEDDLKNFNHPIV